MTSFKNVSSVGGEGIIPLSFDGVPKYDSSSFYNWEQDNLPLFSLEQRSDTLYRALGFPGGNPDGVTFTLSSAGNFDEALGIYDSIDEIIERIPKRLKFPVLIELCTYGNLGSLDLANITCEGDGVLEIRNKAYFEDVNASANGTASIKSSPAGSYAHIDNVYSLDSSSIMLDVSSTRLGATFGNQTSWNDNAHIFCMQGPDTDRQANNLTVHIASSTAADIGDGATNGQFVLQPYDVWHDRTVSASTGDAAPFWGSSTSQYMADQRNSSLYTRGQSAFFGYGNWFSSVSIKDCQGTIVFRNVLVDGAGTSQSDFDTADPVLHLNERGFDIENSEVILDNIASIRNSIYGYFVKNSRLKLTGHCVAWRNYTKTGTDASEREPDGTGILCVNTDIEFDSTYYTDSRKYLNWFGKSKRGMELRNSTMRGGIYSNVTSSIPNAGSLSGLGSSETTPYGTSLANCSGAGGDYKTTTIHASDCNENGIHIEGSDVEFLGRINSYLNQGDGIKAIRSQLRLPQFTFTHNSGYGIELEASQLTYGFGIDKIADEVGAASFQRVDAYPQVFNGISDAAGTRSSTRKPTNRAQFHCSENNQNILATKSSAIAPHRMNNIPFYYGRWGGADWVSDTTVGIGSTGARYTPATHYGATPYRVNNLPGIIITNNSDGEFVNLNYCVSSIDTGKGKVAVASNGSNIIFRGTSGCATTMNYFPVNDDATQFRSWLSAGVAAIDNSNILVTGPTKTARFGIPFMAEGNSQFKATPPCLVGSDNILDISGYSLIEDGAGSTAASANHTSLELHANRSCLVANKQSSISLFALGGRVITLEGAGSTETMIDSVDVLATGYADAYLGDQNNQFDKSTSGGYAKFYPNAFVSGVENQQKGALATGGAFNNDAFDVTKRYIYDIGQHDQGTTGGMVARAVGGSQVDVNLVNFYAFMSPSSVSGAFYHLDGSGCEYVADKFPDIGSGETGIPTTIETEPPRGGTSPGPVGGGDPPGGPTASVEDNYDSGRIIPGSILQGTNALNWNAQSIANDQGLDIYNGAIPVGNKIASLDSGFAGDNHLGAPDTVGDVFSGLPNGLPTNRTRMYGYYSDNSTEYTATPLSKDTSCMGSRIHIWNIADNSRIHASNCLINGLEPERGSLSGYDPVPPTNYHGPGGKWWNGVSLDYYGLGGRRTSYGALGNASHNCGIFRLMLSHRADLKHMYDVSSLSGTVAMKYTAGDGWNGTAFSGGSFVDQINAAGYTHFTQQTQYLAGADARRRANGDVDIPGGVYSLSSTQRVFGWGHPTATPNLGVATMQSRMVGFSSVHNTSDAGIYDQAYIYTQAEPSFPIPPLNMEWQGYLRHFFDETASNVWQNVKHMSEDKVNGVSIYRSSRGSYAGGEGRERGTGENTTSYGAGVRSLNLFDFDRLM